MQRQHENSFSQYPCILCMSTTFLQYSCFIVANLLLLSTVRIGANRPNTYQKLLNYHKPAKRRILQVRLPAKPYLRVKKDHYKTFVRTMKSNMNYVDLNTTQDPSSFAVIIHTLISPNSQNLAKRRYYKHAKKKVEKATRECCKNPNYKLQ